MPRRVETRWDDNALYHMSKQPPEVILKQGLRAYPVWEKMMEWYGDEFEQLVEEYPDVKYAADNDWVWVEQGAPWGEASGPFAPYLYSIPREAVEDRLFFPEEIGFDPGGFLVRDNIAPELITYEGEL